MSNTSPPADPEHVPPGVDISVPHPARVYDYIVGGTNHFAVDRRLANEMGTATGGIERLRVFARANRDFLGRAVRRLVLDAGVRQFLDIGTGIPAADNVHGVAQATSRVSRVVYVDNDPLVLAHASILLESTSEGVTDYVQGDLREPRSILLRAEATLDFSEPVAVMLISVLHLIPNEDDPFGIVEELMAALPSGSYLVISHMATDIETETMAEFSKTPERFDQPLPFAFAMRPRAEVARFFAGLEMVEPGLVELDRWQPDPDVAPLPAPLYGGVARKP